MIDDRLFIAEVKTESPFGFRNVREWKYLFDLAATFGDVVSVHTDTGWGGSFDLLSSAREHLPTGKLLLAKGVHKTDDDVKRAVEECGADYVLVVGRIPRVYLDQCFIEPASLAELSMVPSNVKYAVWNSRDLATGGLKTETFDEARRIWSGALYQASNIHNYSQVHPGADGFIVGAELERFIESIPSNSMRMFR